MEALHRPVLFSRKPPATLWLGAVLLVAAPLVWLSEFFASVSQWLSSDHTRVAAGATALFLIVGGLSILFLIISLFLLQSLFPSRVHTTGSAADTRELRAPQPVPAIRALPSSPHPEPARQRTRGLAAQPRFDIALEAVVRTGVGEPRILRQNEHRTLVRFLECRSCTTRAPKGTVPAPACEYEASLLQTEAKRALGRSVAVHETTCFAMGAPACEFEVRH